MSLITIWKSNPEEIEAKKLYQIVTMAGDGELKDNSDTSKELRSYFSSITTSTLARYLEECLGKSFKDSGLVLQEIVNEMGSRLDCEIEHGLYRGRQGSIGFDGLWERLKGTLPFKLKVTGNLRQKV
jgi:hypothetical protein